MVSGHSMYPIFTPSQSLTLPRSDKVESAKPAKAEAKILRKVKGGAAAVKSEAKKKQSGTSGPLHKYFGKLDDANAVAPRLTKGESAKSSPPRRGRVRSPSPPRRGSPPTAWQSVPARAVNPTVAARGD